jgi:hypothetical protein
MLDSLAHLRESFAGWRVVRISEDTVTAYAARRLADKAKPATVNRELLPVKRMLRLARGRGRWDGASRRHARRAEPALRFFEPDQFRAVRDELPDDLSALASVA